MLIKALLIGIVAGIGILDSRILGQNMIERPIVLAPIVGLILGNFSQGIIIGGTLELVWMGIVGIGAAIPPDVVTGGVLGTAFAIISGKGAAAALALAVPIALLAQSLGILVRTINSYFLHKADKYASEGNIPAVEKMHWIPAILFFLNGFLPTFLAITLGSGAVSAFLNYIPKVIIDGLNVAGGLLPALGIAMLINLMISKKLAPYYFLGFILAAYLKLDIIGIAILATILAFIILQVSPKNKESEV